MLRKKSLVVLLAIVATLLAVLFVFNKKEAPKGPPQPASNQEQEVVTSMDESQTIASEWIKDNAPTYKFDGENLELKDSYEIGMKEINPDTLEGSESKCEDCYEFKFKFSSRHAGYGKRGGQMLAQVITPHTIVVRVESGEVFKAVTDEKFNEMTDEMIENASSEDSDQSDKSIDKLVIKEHINENISDLAPEEEVLGGNFYINEVVLLGSNEALVQYEDGHKAYVAKASYKPSEKYGIIVNSFENVDIEVGNIVNVNFSEEGNLTLENEKPQLVYEKPGEPALTAKLNIGDNVFCYQETGNFLTEKDYEDVSWEEGARVKIHGLEEEGNVDVSFITFLEE